MGFVVVFGNVNEEARLVLGQSLIVLSITGILLYTMIQSKALSGSIFSTPHCPTSSKGQGYSAITARQGVKTLFIRSLQL